MPTCSEALLKCGSKLASSRTGFQAKESQETRVTVTERKRHTRAKASNSPPRQLRLPIWDQPSSNSSTTSAPRLRLGSSLTASPQSFSLQK